jgi:hypothetical protein
LGRLRFRQSLFSFSPPQVKLTSVSSAKRQLHVAISQFLQFLPFHQFLRISLSLSSARSAKRRTSCIKFFRSGPLVYKLNSKILMLSQRLTYMEIQQSLLQSQSRSRALRQNGSILWIVNYEIPAWPQSPPHEIRMGFDEREVRMHWTLKVLNEELIYKDRSFQFLHRKGQSSPHQSSSYQSSSNKKINIATLRVAETVDETKAAPSKIGLGFDSPIT